MTSSNLPTLSKQQISDALRGIMLGRTLHQLEMEGGISMEAFLQAVQVDEETALAFKVAREFSSYVLEDDITTQLRANADNPSSAIKTNALKAWADHAHKQLDARNPAIFSGKASLTNTVPVQIITTLDLNSVKRSDDIYTLEATTTEVRDIITIPDDQLAHAVPVTADGSPVTPLSAAVTRALEERAFEAAADPLDEAIGRSMEADGHPSLGESEPTSSARIQHHQTKATTRQKPGIRGQAKQNRPTRNAKTKKEAP